MKATYTMDIIEDQQREIQHLTDIIAAQAMQAKRDREVIEYLSEQVRRMAEVL